MQFIVIPRTPVLRSSSSSAVDIIDTFKVSLIRQDTNKSPGDLRKIVVTQ